MPGCRNGQMQRQVLHPPQVPAPQIHPLLAPLPLVAAVGQRLSLLRRRLPLLGQPAARAAAAAAGLAAGQRRGRAQQQAVEARWATGQCSGGRRQQTAAASGGG